MRLRLLAPALCLTALLSPAFAATTDYVLDPAASTVAFETDFGPDLITGSIPLLVADLRLDFDQVENCTVDVTLDVAGAKASFPFAAQALKGPKVLDTRIHPRITFESTSVAPAGTAADVTGNLTIRGVTKPISLDVEYAGSSKNPYGQVIVGASVRGSINRKDFGVSWSALLETGGMAVSDTVKLEIDVQAKQA